MTMSGYHHTSFWRGQEWLLSLYTRVLEELSREEILVGSEMQYGQKLGSNNFTIILFFCSNVLHVFFCFYFWWVSTLRSYNI